MLINYFVIGLGAAFGAVSRVLVCHFIPTTICRHIPLQILSINVLGCFAMGLFAGIVNFYWQPSPLAKSFLIPGFLGGFTTFSAFAMDFGLLIQRGLPFYAILYIFLSVGLSLIFFLMGLKLIQLWIS